MDKITILLHSFGMPIQQNDSLPFLPALKIIVHTNIQIHATVAHRLNFCNVLNKNH